MHEDTHRGAKHKWSSSSYQALSVVRIMLTLEYRSCFGFHGHGGSGGVQQTSALFLFTQISSAAVGLRVRADESSRPQPADELGLSRELPSAPNEYIPPLGTKGGPPLAVGGTTSRDRIDVSRIEFTVDEIYACCLFVLSTSSGLIGSVSSRSIFSSSSPRGPARRALWN